MANTPPKRPSGITGSSNIVKDVIEAVRALAEQAESFKEAAGDLPRSVSRGREFTLPGGARGVYGLSIRSGLAGNKPVVNEFGNVKMTNEGVVVSETREPLVDVFDEGGEILVVFELPGVAEADIAVELNGDVLALNAQGPRHRYESETLLPYPVDGESAQQNYENGYLQVRYFKAASPATEDDSAAGRDGNDDG